MNHNRSDLRSLRQAIDEIKAEHHVLETSAYAILIRAATAVPTVPIEHSSEPSPAPTSDQFRLTA
jgi:hypothetical protein